MRICAAFAGRGAYAIALLTRGEAGIRSSITSVTGVELRPRR